MSGAAVAWILAAIVATAALVLILALVRARRLSRWVGTFECDWRDVDDQSWISGIAVYGVDRLDWYRLYSLAPKPRRQWVRQYLDVSGQRRSLPGSQAEMVEVRCGYEGEEFFLALDRGALAGLTSWLEASPPRDANYDID